MRICMYFCLLNDCWLFQLTLFLFQWFFTFSLPYTLSEMINWFHPEVKLSHNSNNQINISFRIFWYVLYLIMYIIFYEFPWNYDNSERQFFIEDRRVLPLWQMKTLLDTRRCELPSRQPFVNLMSCEENHLSFFYFTHIFQFKMN